MQNFLASLRILIATWVICVAGYAAVVWGIAQGLTPATAQGSMITRPDGTIIGSSLIAQKFAEARYFWPRPSAAGKDGYDATSAAGSNKSPTSTDLTDRAKTIIAQYGATAANPLPPELAAASGGGLDPHISVHAALYQAPRVAKARGLPEAKVDALIDAQAFSPGGILTPDRLVNVLEVNLALDRMSKPGS